MMAFDSGIEGRIREGLSSPRSWRLSVRMRRLLQGYAKDVALSVHRFTFVIDFCGFEIDRRVAN